MSEVEKSEKRAKNSKTYYEGNKMALMFINKVRASQKRILFLLKRNRDNIEEHIVNDKRLAYSFIDDCIADIEKHANIMRMSVDAAPDFKEKEDVIAYIDVVAKQFEAFEVPSVKAAKIIVEQIKDEVAATRDEELGEVIIKGAALTRKQDKCLPRIKNMIAEIEGLTIKKIGVDNVEAQCYLRRLDEKAKLFGLDISSLRPSIEVFSINEPNSAGLMLAYMHQVYKLIYVVRPGTGNKEPVDQPKQQIPLANEAVVQNDEEMLMTRLENINKVSQMLIIELKEKRRVEDFLQKINRRIENLKNELDL